MTTSGLLAFWIASTRSWAAPSGSGVAAIGDQSATSIAMFWVSSSIVSRAAGDIDRSLRVAAGDLQRTMHDLLDVVRGADLVVVFHILPDDAALIVDVLNPVDEFVAAAPRFALLRERRHARKDEHRDTRLGRIVHPAAERLRPAIDMHDDRLGAARQLRVAMGAAHRDHFVRTGSVVPVGEVGRRQVPHRRNHHHAAARGLRRLARHGDRTSRPGLRRPQGAQCRRGCCASPSAPFRASPRLVTYAELSTPLTVEHYTSHPAGRFYGLPGTPERYRSAAFGVRTPIPGLYLTGSDAASLGVPGAMFGGLAAASRVLGRRLPAHMAAVRRGAETLRRGRRGAAEGKEARRRRRQDRADASIWRLEFELDAALAFVPGQYVKLQVAPFEWRDYSIAAAAGRRLTLLISNRTHGDGSNWADAAKVGEATEIEGPFGAYRLERNNRRKVFVATGTGLAPFLSMFEAMAATGELEKAELYFGCRTPDEDITAAFADKPRRTVACVTRAAPPPGGFAGRVTKAIARLTFDPTGTDFYVCGSAAMVADCRDLSRAPARSGS